MREGKTVRTEWKKHLLVLPEGPAPKAVSVNDMWIDRPADAPFYSSAFTGAIFGRGKSAKRAGQEGTNLQLQVMAANIRPNEVLALAAG
jgi:4-alpha-glucanotransferase